MQIFYKNSTDENLSPLSIPNCGVKCSMENLFRIYEPILPTENFETECRLSLLSMTYKDADFKGLENSKSCLCIIQNSNKSIYCFIYLVSDYHRFDNDMSGYGNCNNIWNNNMEILHPESKSKMVL